MAWRLDEAIEHGMIDNTVEGTTTGKIWLVGRDEPLILSLNGDCWRDLAGTVLEFENPNPQACSEANSLDTDQIGIVGDITASRKARIPEISEDEMLEFYHQNREIPCKWRNLFYMEWFSEINGRVLVEAAGYKLRVSGREWEMDSDSEEAQKLANMNSMRDFMNQVIHQDDDSKTPKKNKTKSKQAELNEFEWEKRLKESDRVTDAYQEVLEKYIDDPDAERKEAFVMGWDGLLGAMADREENGDDFEEEDEEDDWQAIAEDEDFFIEEGAEDFQIKEEPHPLQARAHKLALSAFGIVSSTFEDSEEPRHELTSRLMRISTKLAGVLNDRASGYQPESGFVLAVLKRCLSWINEAIGACNQIMEAEKDAGQIATLERLRTEMFEIRNGIIEIRRSLKQR